MHKSSYFIMQKFVEFAKREYFKDKINITVLDVGSADVGYGSYRDLFDKNLFIYTGLDLEKGNNVDYVPGDMYDWRLLDNESFDIIISGQVFEHIEFPWLTIKEIAKKLKIGGLACIIAPSRGPEHRYPVDCYRYYPDGMKALAKWANLEVVSVKTTWGNSGFLDGSDNWGDTFCIMKKGKIN